jgi:hypothetical protein
LVCAKLPLVSVENLDLGFKVVNFAAATSPIAVVPLSIVVEPLQPRE